MPTGGQNGEIGFKSGKRRVAGRRKWEKCGVVTLSKVVKKAVKVSKPVKVKKTVKVVAKKVAIKAKKGSGKKRKMRYTHAELQQFNRNCLSSDQFDVGRAR